MEKPIPWLETNQRDLEKRLLREFSETELRKHLEYLTGFYRRAGTEGELKAATYIREKLEGYGVDAAIHEVDAYISLPGTAELEVLSPVQRSIPCFPRIFSKPTPEEGLEAELISLGRGSEEDYEGLDLTGKVVLIESDKESRGEATWLAREKGIPQIHVTPGERGAIHLGGLRNDWGNPTPETIEKIGRTSALSICREDGTLLSELIREGRVLIRMKADAPRGYRKIRVPVGFVQGKTEPQRYVLVAGHYCSWFAGATDNAVANSLMLELARIFSRYRKRLARGVRFAWWSGHEQGQYAGSTWYLDTFWDDIRDHAVAYLAMDGLGRKGSLGFESRNTEEIRRFQHNVIKDILGIEVKGKRPSKSGDQTFWCIGLPSFTARAAFSAEQMKSMAGDPIWYSHTAEDTLDQVDMNLVPSHAAVYIASIARLCGNPVLPFDFLSVAQGLEEGLERDGGESSPDLGPVRVELKAMREKILFLHKTIEKHLRLLEREKGRGDRTKLENVNRCLMELGRVLLPILSTRSGRYGQDEEGFKWRPVPVLEPLEGLASMEKQSDLYRAWKTSLLRERNKVSDALRSAHQILDGTVRRL